MMNVSGSLLKLYQNNMFSYYGSKASIINFYSSPQENKIIEPFAGSAAYSLRYWEKEVLLCDKYPKITEVWRYLISAPRSEIESLPVPRLGESLDSYSWLSDVEKDLIGFCIACCASPQNIVTERGDRGNRPNSQWAVRKDFIIRNLYKIRHWKLFQGSYSHLANERATWFIDPPYQKAGKYYIHSDIDYKHLCKWSLSREGQIIVCENLGADWLNFQPLTIIRGVRKSSVEVIFERKGA